MHLAHFVRDTMREAHLSAILDTYTDGGGRLTRSTPRREERVRTAKVRPSGSSAETAMTPTRRRERQMKRFESARQASSPPTTGSTTFFPSAATTFKPIRSSHPDPGPEGLGRGHTAPANERHHGRQLASPTWLLPSTTMRLATVAFGRIRGASAFLGRVAGGLVLHFETSSAPAARSPLRARSTS